MYLAQLLMCDYLKLFFNDYCFGVSKKVKKMVNLVVEDGVYCMILMVT